MNINTKKVLNITIFSSLFLLGGFFLNSTLAEAADRYWVGGTGNWSDDDNHWATTSGGVGADTNIPTAADNCIFDSLSNATAYTVTVDASATCLDLNFSTAPASSGNITFAGSSALAVSGNMTMLSGMSFTYTGAMTFNGLSSKTITSNSLSFTIQNIVNNITVGNGLVFSSAEPSVVTLTQGTDAILSFTDTVPTIYSLDADASPNTVRYAGASQNLLGAQWDQVGNSLAITTGNPVLTSLTSTRVAFFDNTNLEIRTYDFNGTDWVQVGNSLAIASAGSGSVATLSSSRIAFLDDINDELRTYDFNGTDWVQIGNGLTVSGSDTPALGALSSTRVAFSDRGNDVISTYDFDGTDWVQVGNSFSLGVTSVIPKIAVLSSSRIAFTGKDSGSLRTYDFNGTDWAQVGNSLTVSGAGNPALTALSSSRVAQIDNASKLLRTYDFDGTNWTLKGSLSVALVLAPALTTLSSNRVAFIDSWNDELRTYDFNDGIYHDLSVESSGTVTLDNSISVNGELEILDGTLSLGSNSISFYGASGSPFTNADTVDTGTGTISYLGNNTSGDTTIETNGLTYYNLTLNNSSESFVPNGQILGSSSGALTLTSGTLDLNNNNMTFGSFSSSNSNTRSLILDSEVITLTGTGTAWNVSTSSGMSLISGDSTIKLTNTSSTLRSFAGGGLTYSDFWSDAGSSTAILQITGANTFYNFRDTGGAAHTIKFSTNTTQNFSNWTVSGSQGNVITIASMGIGTSTHTLNKIGGGAVSSDYLNIQHSIATPAEVWYAGGNSVNNQSVVTAGSGWIFSNPPSEATSSGSRGQSRTVDIMTSAQSTDINACTLFTVYSPLTGAKCPKITTPIDCISSYSFSPSTGQSCSVYTNSPTTPVFTFLNNLSLNMTHPDVLNLQKYLNAYGFLLVSNGPGSPNNETNFFGSLTRTAVIKFQTANNLIPDGIVGPITRGVLNALN